MPSNVPIQERISPEYAAEMRLLHEDPRGFGSKGDKWLPNALAMLADCGGTLLDYGCGTGGLVLAVLMDGKAANGYDPCVPEWASDPHPASVVFCTDCLEHVEEDKVPAVLRHIRNLTKRKLFAVIATCETKKTLSDGRQAHITLHPPAWWVLRLNDAGFHHIDMVPTDKPEKHFALVAS